MSFLPSAIRRLALLGAVGGGGYYAWQEYTQPHEEEVKTVKLQARALTVTRRFLWQQLAACWMVGWPSTMASYWLALEHTSVQVRIKPGPVLGGLSQERVPPRDEQIKRLRAATKDAPFDVLIIGGGATGTGCAVDAVTRCVGESWPTR